MILRRLSEHLKAQNWTAVALEFIVDLEADTATARRGVARADDGDRHAETLLALIETGAAAGTGDPDLIRAVLVAGYVYLPRATRGTYDELISTGHLRLIRDGLIAGARVRPDLPGALAAGLEGELMLLRRLSHHLKTQNWTA